VRCDKNEMPVAALYRTIEEHIVLKGRLESIQVFRELFTIFFYAIEIAISNTTETLIYIYELKSTKNAFKYINTKRKKIF